MEGSSKREQLLQRPRGERAYGEGGHENSSVWLEHGLGGETWEEMKLKRNRRQTVRGTLEPMEDPMLRHWLLSYGHWLATKEF